MDGLAIPRPITINYCDGYETQKMNHRIRLITCQKRFLMFRLISREH